jgi:hypothetical protein
MNRQVLIDKTVNKIRQLPDTKIQEINDFAEFLLSKIDDRIILENIQKLSSLLLICRAVKKDLQ